MVCRALASGACWRSGARSLIFAILVLAHSRTASAECAGQLFTGDNYTATFTSGGAWTSPQECNGTRISNCIIACCAATETKDCLFCQCSDIANEQANAALYGSYRNSTCDAVPSGSGTFCPNAFQQVTVLPPACQAAERARLVAIGCQDPTASIDNLSGPELATIAIVGIVIGAVGFLVLVAVVLWVLLWQRRRKRRRHQDLKVGQQEGGAKEGRHLGQAPPGPDPEKAVGLGDPQAPALPASWDAWDSITVTKDGFRAAHGPPLPARATGIDHDLELAAKPGSGGLVPSLRILEGANSQGVATSGTDMSDALPQACMIAPEALQVYCENGKLASLGNGAQGLVYKGCLHGTTDVAIKVLRDDAPTHKKRFLREIAVIASLRHPNVVPFFGACAYGPQIALVMEFMPGGDLFTAMQRDGTPREYGWHRRGPTIALGIAKGLHHLHSQRPPILHLDLKSPNILLGADGLPCIGDIGLAKRLSSPDAVDTVTSCLGSLPWAAPEQLEGEPVSRASDVFSFGVVLWEICTGDRPVRGKLRPLRLTGQDEEPDCPAEIAELIRHCMQQWPAARPAALDVHNILKRFV